MLLKSYGLNRYDSLHPISHLMEISLSAREIL